MIPAQINPLVVPAGGAFRLLVAGDYFKIITATGAVRVTGSSFGRLGPLLPGQGLEQTPFDWLEFTDLTGADNTLTVLTADEKFVDDRITGEVSVIDGGKARTESGVVFAASPLVGAAGAGTNGVLQLWNSSANKRLIVTQCSAGAAAGTAVQWYPSTAALTNDFTATYLASKRMGNAVAGAAGQLRWLTPVGIPATPLGVPQMVYILGNSTYVWTPRNEPIVVPPGKGLSIANRTPNADLLATFEWWEELV